MGEIRLEAVTRAFHGQAVSRPGYRADEENQIATHGQVAALDQIDLTIPDGKTVVLLGPSGCGKSTLLRVVAGLDLEYDGRVLYDGKDMREVPPKDRNIGMVFQNYALYPHFMGQGNLSFTFWVRKAPNAEAEARIRETAEMMGFGFSQLLARKPGTLSGGQQQRLAIARALVRKPDLFLLDEPLSNLDAKLRAQTRVEIRRLLNRFRITTIYVTHDQEEATGLADLIAVMRAGRVEQMGTYHELRDNPRNAFVAGFVGSPPMNLADGVVTAQNTVQVGGAELPLPGAVLAQAAAGQRVVVGVRAEALALALGQDLPPDVGLLAGTVQMVEPDYARRVQYVRVETPVGDFTVVDATNEPLAVTQAVQIVLPAAQTYFFSTETGARLG
ncbi:MAG: ABC transporter ATP-binding protein [Litorilinea sp.]